MSCMHRENKQRAHMARARHAQNKKDPPPIRVSELGVWGAESMREAQMAAHTGRERKRADLEAAWGKMGKGGSQQASTEAKGGGGGAPGSREGNKGAEAEGRVCRLEGEH